MIPVIDIAKWQGDIDFHAMCSRGVKGVIIRAGNGIDRDPRFDEYVRAAKEADLATGAYWFCNPRIGTSIIQGQMLAAAHNRVRCELPPMLDVESYANEKKPLPDLTPAQFAVWLRVMVAEVEHLARRPFFYSNAAFWNPHVADATFGDFDIIVARYPFYSPTACAAHVPPVDAADWDEWIMAATTARPQVPKGWSTWSGWQFSAGYNGRGHVYGVSSGDLDLNIIRDDVWQRWLSHEAPSAHAGHENTAVIAPPIPPVVTPPAVKPATPIEHHQEDHDMANIGIIHLDDADAVLMGAYVGPIDGPRFLDLHWVHDPASQSIADAHITAGATVFGGPSPTPGAARLVKANVRNCYVDILPTGDNRTTWTSPADIIAWAV